MQPSCHKAPETHDTRRTALLHMLWLNVELNESAAYRTAYVSHVTTLFGCTGDHKSKC